VKRYFAARGPATIPDFVWWSGLTSADAKRGLEMVNADLEQTLIDGQPHWMSPESFTTKDEATVYLLSGFDEFLLSYTDRSASLNAQSESAWHRGGGMFRPVIVIDGQVAGTWERTLRKKNVLIEYTPLRPFSAAEQEAFKAAAQRYADFLGLALSPIINPAN
jgi:hypothetical protein